MTVTGAMIAMIVIMAFTSSFSLGAQADVSARSLGRIIDVATLTTDDVDFRVKCPGKIVFVEGNRIQVRESNVFGSSDVGQYYYMSESDAILPLDKEIDCSVYSYIRIEKTTDPNNLKSTITVEGEEA